MATDEISSPAPSHVPAWKKLGLKLKYAKEEVPAQRDGDRDVSGEAQDGMEVDGAVKEGSEKKKNKSKKRRLEEDGEDGEDGAATAAAGGEDNGSEKKKNKKSKKHRKVSFSADTKVHDGDDEEDEEDEEEEKKTGGDSLENGVSEAALVDEKQKEEKKRRMKEKKDKKKKQDQQEPTDPSDTPILTYLHLYHQDRPAWKFQKNRETQLFKHVLSLERVPTEYNAALLAYLQGLKSEAARQRLGQTAEEIIKSEMEVQAATEVNTEEDKPDDQNAPDMTDYYKTVEAFRIRLSQGKDELNDVDALGEGQVTRDLRKKLEKRLRAEAMWFAINGKLFYIQKPKGSQKATPQQNGKQAQSAGKKKKNRTVIVDISSSSESESDNDDDNNASQKTKPAKQQASAKTKKKSRTAVEDSSSSSDSDSSSDSESDSDGDKKKNITKPSKKESSDSSSDSGSDSD